MVRGSTWDENESWQAVVKSTEVHGCVAEKKMRTMIGGEQWETYLKRILKKSKGVTGASLMRY